MIPVTPETESTASRIFDEILLFSIPPKLHWQCRRPPPQSEYLDSPHRLVFTYSNFSNSVGQASDVADRACGKRAHITIRVVYEHHEYWQTASSFNV
jgi:hypothetical protein